MDRLSQRPAAAGARLGALTTGRAYRRDDLEAALFDLAARREAIRQSIDEARDRAADLSAAASAATTLHHELATTWLDAEHRAAEIRATADARATDLLAAAEQRASRIVAEALADAPATNP